MIEYGDVYEILRKEKYSEVLQPLPKNLVEDFSKYLQSIKESSEKEENILSGSGFKVKKEMENALSIFRELILRRKKKILNLVFIATETGIMKRDYENMMAFERDVFDNLVKTFEEGDKFIADSLNGRKEKQEEKHKMIIFNQDVNQFIDMKGGVIGPFSSGELANLDVNVAEILVGGGKADFVDDE